MSGIYDLWRTGRGCCLAIVVLALLLLLGACVALGWGVAKWTEAAEEPGLDVMLLIDQSGSLWELGGVGTDPDLLRMEGARLFAATLGVDGAAATYRLGAVYFGSQPRLVAPLTPLTGQDNDREALLTTLAHDPQPMGWTDVNAALALAYHALYESELAAPDRTKAVVLFTDGRPQTEALTTPAATQTYLDALRHQIQMFTDQGAVVYTVLLGNATSDADTLTRDVYRPLWVGLAEAGEGVTFYDARSSQDLAPIYHDIVAQLHRSNSQGMVVQETVRDSLEASVEVAQGWQTATFVVHKSAPDLEVTLIQPDGQPLPADAPGVRYSGQLAGRYETWSIDWPPAGPWRVRIAGRGAVAVWLDYRPAAATSTATASPTRTATPTATRTPTETPSATASPTPAPTATPSPTATALAIPAPRPENEQPQRGVAWGWLAGAGLGLAAVVVVGGGLRRRRNRPHLAGVLRVIRSPAGQTVGQSWDLSAQRHRSVTLGSGPRCAVGLVGDAQLPAQAAQIRSPTAVDSGPLLIDLTPQGAVRVNDGPAGKQRVLADGDSIELGGYQLRYENLALRRQGRPSTAARKPTDFNLDWSE